MNNKLALPIVTLLLLSSLTAFSQKNQDFIINLNGDTLWGKIKLPARSQLLTFKVDKTKVQFRPNSLLLFGIYNKNKKDHIIYRSIRTFKNEKKFLLVLAEGDLQLFEEKRYKSSNRGLSIYTIYYVGRTRESLQLMTPYTYEEVMQHFLKDRTQIAQKLDQATFYDIPELVKAFNEETIGANVSQN